MPRTSNLILCLIAMAGCAAPGAETLPTVTFEAGKADLVVDVDVTGQMLQFDCVARPCTHGVRLTGSVQGDEGLGVLVAVASPTEVLDLNRRLQDDPASLADAIYANELFTMEAMIVSAADLEEGVDVRVHVYERGPDSLFVRALSAQANGVLDVRARRELLWDRAVALVRDETGRYTVRTGDDGETGLWTFHVEDELDLDWQPDFEVNVFQASSLRTEVVYVCDATGEVIEPERELGILGVFYNASITCDSLDDSAQVYILASPDQAALPYEIVAEVH